MCHRHTRRSGRCVEIGIKKMIERILKEQEKSNVNNRFATVNRETGRLLHLLVKIKNPKNILEVGTSIGYSTIWMASALSKGAKLTTLEHSPDRSEIAEKFFKRSKLNIRLIQGDSLKMIPKLKEKFDVIFLDATKSQYLRYLKAARLNKNALIIADNSISHELKMKDFLDYANKKGAVTLNIGSGITVLTSEFKS